MRGRSLNVRFEIIDKRSGTVAGPVLKGQLDESRIPRGPYTVLATIQVGGAAVRHLFKLSLLCCRSSRLAAGKFCIRLSSVCAERVLL